MDNGSLPVVRGLGVKVKFIEDMVQDVPINSFKIRFEEAPSPSKSKQGLLIANWESYRETEIHNPNMLFQNHQLL